MARQGGWVQVEQSNMHLVLIIAKMATGDCLCAATEETQYLIKKPHANVPEEIQQAMKFPGHR
jgi:hypothetical protein